MKSWMTLLITLNFAIYVRAEGPCKTDIEKFCAGVQPGGGAVVKCLKEHEAEVSSECKARGEEMKKHVHQVKDACEADVEKFCSSLKPGKKAILKCLKKNKKNLSEACKESFSRKK
jgi:hypothetical protein